MSQEVQRYVLFNTCDVQFEIYKYGVNDDGNDDNDDDKEDLCMYHMHGCNVDCEVREAFGFGLNFPPFEQKVLTFKKNNALNLCTYPWPVGLFVTKFGSGLGAFIVTAIFGTLDLWQ